MQRYLETLFRRSALFLVPFIVVPALTLVITSYNQRQYEVRATVWVERGQILARVGLPGAGVNEVVAQGISDRLRTLDFLGQVMDQSGLTDAILAGEWPTSSRLQRQLNTVPILRNVRDILGLAPPNSVDEAMGAGIGMVSRSLRVTSIGENLVRVAYFGSEPLVGQRLIEETLRIHQQEDMAARTRESEVGTEYLTGELQTQEGRFLTSAAKLERFQAEFPPPPFGLERAPEEQQELQRLQQALELNRTSYVASLDRLENLRLASSAVISTADLHFRILDPPKGTSAASTVSLRTMGMMGMLGGTLGTLMGTVAIVLTTWRDGMIRTRADVERTIETDVIVEVPLLPGPAIERLTLLKAAMGLAYTGSQHGQGAPNHNG